MSPKTCARIFSLLLVLAGTYASAHAQDCLSYDPATVELTGSVIRRTMPGPPNYESVRKGDRPEIVSILRLARPVCVTGNTDDINVPEQNVTDLQLVLDEKQFARVRELTGRNVRVAARGKLFHAHTAHHRTNVLLAVETLRRVD